MADNIMAQAAKYPGRRLVVICGVDHKYALRDLLAKEPGVKVLEYYEIANPSK
ncbi:MAG: ChaN family lipoprotein [Acidobacteria bacterium]|nr:ChaN family lipoprotein [Acidobacteriota bacterium]